MILDTNALSAWAEGRATVEAPLRSAERLVVPSVVLGEYYFGIRLELKRSGSPIPANDVWVAALARQHALAVLSNDSHFDVVEGVRRIAF